ncbi:predicted protein [Histoplasma capsulatum H143]|uniref:Uncharacterized protein n=1 Tax=Ajellomyces capsulatus (strain H143) TaxID=544712 RepID=C6HPM7_AJECH|nr:predicted protein [Histoplasma capsulatum H143]
MGTVPKAWVIPLEREVCESGSCHHCLRCHKLCKAEVLPTYLGVLIGCEGQSFVRRARWQILARQTGVIRTKRKAVERALFHSKKALSYQKYNPVTWRSVETNSIHGQAAP